ncbi:MAG: nitroreductase family protein, partial [Traorella sp.]
ENIKTRRSCRSFLDKNVDEKDIEAIVECGILAPSAKNNQEVRFCVVTNPTILKRIVQQIGQNVFYDAPVVITVYSDEKTRFTELDGASALTQMHLAAHELGYGSCWVNHLRRFENDEAFDDIYNEIGLKGKTIVGSLVVGHEDKKPKERIMKDVQKVFYYK